MKQFAWSGNPKIGWWKDRNMLMLYHGTHIDNLKLIADSGYIKAPTSGPTANWVSMALEPNTSLGYASMGGESAFRAAGAKASHIPINERGVLVAKVPMTWVLKNMETNFRGNTDGTRTRLTNKAEYDEWSKTDQEYYALTELRFPKTFPTRFIVGFMKKDNKKFVIEQTTTASTIKKLVLEKYNGI